MFEVYLSLGSNVGDRIDNLTGAMEEINKYKNNLFIGIKSSFYETEPVGFLDQPFFINMALMVHTTYEPIELLNICKKIELTLGRKKREHMHEREIDLDILFFNGIVIESEILTVPHKELYNRRFVLEPLNEIAPDFICPKTNKSVSSLFFECRDRSQVKRINK
jgi:2-amino-4-hydroxy-6-hydroxymethyldihydropteridine diphosphokinase